MISSRISFEICKFSPQAQTSIWHSLEGVFLECGHSMDIAPSIASECRDDLQ